MAKLTSGVFADTAFPESVWVDNVWAEYGTAVVDPIVRGIQSRSDPLNAKVSMWK